MLFVPDDHAGDVTVGAHEISLIDATASGTVETTGSGNGSSIAVNGITMITDAGYMSSGITESFPGATMLAKLLMGRS